MEILFLQSTAILEVRPIAHSPLPVCQLYAHEKVKRYCRRLRQFESLEPRCLLALDTVAATGIMAQYFSDVELQTIFATRLACPIARTLKIKAST